MTGFRWAIQTEEMVQGEGWGGGKGHNYRDDTKVQQTGLIIS